ncbi:MAG: HlyD family efflux transporter periplasmic adaptor subunit [Phycisphaerales bacterium]|nr:HlyD family efflux transporter periplasmic adaptor subunit [Phycisphaerales bacterium]
MKIRWIVVLGAVLILIGGWQVLRNQRFPNPFDQPKVAEITRGDVRVPITAAGLIEPKQRIAVKSEASGEVIELNVEAGDFVRQGDVLARLDPEDEQRNRDRASEALIRANAQLEQSKVALADAENSVLIRQSTVKELEAQLEFLEQEFVHAEDERQRGIQSERGYVQAKTSRDRGKAQLDGAVAAVTAAQLAVDNAKVTIKIQGALVNDSEKSLEDADERLRETTIVAPIDGLVTEVSVQIGSLVQAGTGIVGGGTILLTLADVSKLKVLARVDEADIGRVRDIAPIDALPQMPGYQEAIRRQREKESNDLAGRVGDVKLTVDAFPENTYAGRIERVEPQGRLNPGVAIIQFDVHVEVTDDDRYELPLGTQAQVEFTVESALDTLRVPAEAVKSFQGQRGLWLKTNPPAGSKEFYGKQFVPCQFGISDGAYTELIRANDDKIDLKPGVVVYTKLPPEDES